MDSKYPKTKQDVFIFVKKSALDLSPDNTSIPYKRGRVVPKNIIDHYNLKYSMDQPTNQPNIKSFVK